MKTPQLLNYERDRWIGGDGNLTELPSAIDGAPVALTGSGGLDFGAMLRHAREVGGPALRKLTFHERARMLKALGLAILARKEELYELNYQTGATRKDGWIDIEGGAGTLFSFSSKGRRELPDAHVLLDGQLEACRSRARSSASTSTPRSRARRSTSTPSTSRSGGCSEKLGADLARGRPGDREAGLGDRLSCEAAFRIMIEANVLPRARSS
jgi:oxepin-CoA hydrolase/3-oxo-5,6-dehydrosuberyl-CoA semialdehyde dehydrogenase